MKSLSACVAISLTGCAVAWCAPPAAEVFPGKQWEEASPESQGVDSAKLAAAAEYLRQHAGRDGVRELVIVRNGYLIWKGDNIDKVHGIWSCTKSFTSTCLGLLIDDGKCTLQTRAQDFVPAMAKSYPEVTLRHFTTMTSGYRAVGDEPRGGYLHGLRINGGSGNANNHVSISAREMARGSIKATARSGTTNTARSWPRWARRSRGRRKAEGGRAVSESGMRLAPRKPGGRRRGWRLVECKGRHAEHALQEKEHARKRVV